MRLTNYLPIKQLLSVLVVYLMVLLPVSVVDAIQITSEDPVVISKNSATISFRTDVASTAEILYGTTLSKDNKVTDSNPSTSHIFNLVNLDPATRHFYKIVARDTNSNGAPTRDKEFRTLDSQPPIKVSNLKKLSATTSSISLGWDSVLPDPQKGIAGDNDLDKYLIFRDGQKIAETDTNFYADTNLLSSTQYTYQVQERDTAGIVADKSNPLVAQTALPDIRPPSITELKVLSLGVQTASFEILSDEDVNLTFSYGDSPHNLNVVESVGIFKKSHELSLINLIKLQEYHYLATVCDTSGNCVNSQPASFIPGSDVTPPEINTTIPRYVNNYVFPIIGNTEPFSIVELYVNDRFTARDPNTGKNGIFSLRTQLRANQINTIKIVAQDIAGNKNELTADVELDNKKPEINMSALPSFLGDEDLVMSGYVDEDVTITFSTLDLSAAPIAPRKLNASREANKVELSWEAVQGITKYIIYRNNLAIAVVDTTQYPDDKVKSGSLYHYAIAALKDTGILGAKSTPLSVTTKLLGGKTNVGDDTVVEVDLTQHTVASAEQTLQANGDFSFTIPLQEGQNSVTLTFEDKAGNKREFKKQVLVDTIAPVLLEPLNLDFYSPSYDPAIELRGKVDTPGAIVVVTVNDKCSGKALPTSATGIYRKLTTDFACKTIADPDGNFKINIELSRFGSTPDTTSQGLDTQGFNSGSQAGRGEAGIGSINRNQQFDRDAFTANQIKIVAVDVNGLESPPIEGVIEYRACGQDGAWTIDIPEEEFTPKLVYSEHMLKGIAQFGFNLNLKYQGAGDPRSAQVTGEPRFTEFELSEDQQKKFGHRNLLTAPTASWSDDYKNGHVLYSLKKWDLPDEELKKGKVDKLSFPIMIEIDYATEDFSGNPIIATQKTCDTLTIGVEHRLNVEKHIPEAFLRSSIHTINKTIELIDKLLEPLQKLQTVLFFSCFASWAGMWLWDSLFNEWSCVGVRENAVGTLAIQENWPGKASEPKTCEDGNLDETQKAQCMSCVDKFKSYRRANKLTHLLCDRVWCPSVPDLAKHKELYRDPYLAGIAPGVNSACHGRSQDSYFQSEASVFNAAQQTQSNFNRVFGGGSTSQDSCKEEYVREYEHACLFMDEWGEATTPPDPSDTFGNVFKAVADMCKPSPNKKDEVVRQSINEGGEQTYEEFVRKDGKLYRVTGKIEKQALGDGADDAPGTISQVKGDSRSVFSYDEQSPLLPYYNVEGRNKEGKLYRDVGPPYDGKISIEEKTAQDNAGTPIDISGNTALQNEFDPPGDYIVDPTSGLIRSAQCACVPAMTGYLTLWKGILQSVRKCFQSVLITKKAQTGLCKSVLTTYVCDLVYDVIRCISKKYSAGSGASIQAQTGLGGFFSAMSAGSQKITNSISNRYGQTSMYNSMFSQKKLIHAVCIGAFTGDWDIDVQQFMQGGFAIPIKSEGWVPTSTRRFITADPNNDGLATYMYHVGAGLVAGSPVDWNLELVCSNSHDCDNEGSPDSSCDCALGTRPGEEVLRIDGGRLSAGESIGSTDAKGDRYIPITRPFRYDKLRLRWSYTDNNNQQVSDEVVNPIKLVGGDAPAKCKFGLDGFTCGIALGEKGTVRFVEKPTPKKKLYSAGNKIKLNAEIIKQSPGYIQNNPDVDLGILQIGVSGATRTDEKKQIPKWMVARLFNQHGSPVSIVPGSATSEYRQVLRLDTRDIPYSTETDDSSFKLQLLPESYTVSPEDFLPRVVGQGTVTTHPVSQDTTKLPANVVRTQILNAASAPFDWALVMRTDNNKKICEIFELNSYEPQNPQTSQPLSDVNLGSILHSDNNCKNNRRITYGNLVITVGRFVEDTKYAILYNTPAPSTQQTNDACTANKVQWRLEVELHHGIKANENSDWSASNFNPETPGEIAKHKGSQQAYRGNDAILIDVVCDQNAVQDNSNTNCAIGPILTNTCTCNKDRGLGCPESGRSACYAPTRSDSDTNYACRKHPRCKGSISTQLTSGCVCVTDADINKEPDCGTASTGSYCYKATDAVAAACHPNRAPTNPLSTLVQGNIYSVDQIVSLTDDATAHKITKFEMNGKNELVRIFFEPQLNKGTEHILTLPQFIKDVR
jgi:hypothetical protein